MPDKMADRLPCIEAAGSTAIPGTAMYDLHHSSRRAWNAEKMLCLGGLGGLHGDNIFKKRGWDGNLGGREV